MYSETSIRKILGSAYTRGGYSHTLPIRVCAAQQGRDFEAPDLERGIHFRIKLAAKTVDEDPASCKRWISRKEIKTAKM